MPGHFQGVNFADDTNILVNKDEEALQHKVTLVMRQLEIWLGKNDLIVNIDKTWAILFHPHQNNHPTRPHITFKNNEIAYSSELKSLGLFITETLAWHAQIHSLCASLSKSYYIMIKSMRNVTSTQMIWSTYFAYFQSRLRYGIMFWGGDGKSIKIFRLQKKVIRLITGVHKHESCTKLYK